MEWIDGIGWMGYKTSLAFGKTSAGIVFCFWGMFDTISGPRGDGLKLTRFNSSITTSHTVYILDRKLIHNYIIKPNASKIKSGNSIQLKYESQNQMRWYILSQNPMHQKFHHKIQFS